jgi:hypothetical protein
MGINFVFSPPRKNLKKNPPHKTAHLQITPANPQTKICKRAIFLPLLQCFFVTLYF